MGIEPRVAAVAASGVLGAIGRYGGDCDRIFGAARVARDVVTDPAGQLDLRAYCDMFEQAARQTGVETFGLRFGAGYRIEEMGAMGALVLNSPTLGAALKNLCDFFPAVQEHSSLGLAEAGGLVALRYEIKDGRIAQRRQDAELSIGIFMNLLRRCLGAGWAPEEIQFEHLRGAEGTEVRSVLGAPVYFAAAGNAILFRRGELAARMPGAEAARLPGLMAQLGKRAAAARPAHFVGRVIAEIRRNFAGGEASIDRVARTLGMSRTGLYRRLAAEGVDFSRLTQEVRREMAMIYVGQPGIALSDIAALLGYSELSAFTRAFTRWTGCAPARYRAELRSCC